MAKRELQAHGSTPKRLAFTGRNDDSPLSGAVASSGNASREPQTYSSTSLSPTESALPTPYAPAWGRCPRGKQRYWTRERVLEGLRLAARELDPLPTTSDVYNHLKKGHMEWPTAQKIAEHFGGMVRGWLAAGVSRRRVQLTNSRWTAAEDEYLLTMAGSVRLVDIARSLNRSYQAVRVRIGSKGFGLKARQNQGYFTACEMAKEYHCSYHRLLTLLAEGVVKGKYRPKLHRWEIDPADATDEVVSLLRAAKRTHKKTPPDLGDYRKRYGIRRINGQRLPQEVLAL